MSLLSGPLVREFSALGKLSLGPYADDVVNVGGLGIDAL